LFKEKKMKRLILIMFIITVVMMSPLFGQNFTPLATIDQEFCGSSVLVIMNEEEGGINKYQPISRFTGFEAI